jgi:hypothetical protein
MGRIIRLGELHLQQIRHQSYHPYTSLLAFLYDDY